MADGIRVIERAVDILQAFTFDDSELSLAEICEKVDLPKTTVFRIINTLEHQNFLDQNRQNGKYHLGYELIKLGEQAKNSNELSRIAYEYMLAASEASKQTCNLYVKEGDERLCIAQVTGSEYIRKHSYLGARHPLYCGAGKLILAFERPQVVDEYLSNVALVKITENTITDKEKLKEELEKIRNCGYAISLGERDSISASVAVPVFDYSKQLVAALTISGPLHDFTESGIHTYIDILKVQAQKMSSKLGN